MVFNKYHNSVATCSTAQLFHTFVTKLRGTFAICYNQILLSPLYQLMIIIASQDSLNWLHSGEDSERVATFLFLSRNIVSRIGK